MVSGLSHIPSAALAPFLEHEKGIQFAVLGDAEPKPHPEFEHLRSAVEVIEAIHAERAFNFVAGIGDLPHRGKPEQYEIITKLFSSLTPPLYPILGNEELRGTQEDISRFLEFATRWNNASPHIEATRYTIDTDQVRFVFASADTDGKNLSGDEVDWIQEQLDTVGERPVVLFIHTAPQGVFPAGRAMADPIFDRVADHESLAVAFSGHSHMNLNTVKSHVVDEFGTHHVHVPGLERTKVGDTHVPWLRLAVITPDDVLQIETYNVQAREFTPDHQVTIPLR